MKTKADNLSQWALFFRSCFLMIKFEWCGKVTYTTLFVHYGCKVMSKGKCNNLVIIIIVYMMHSYLLLNWSVAVCGCSTGGNMAKKQRHTTYLQVQILIHKLLFRNFRTSAAALFHPAERQTEVFVALGHNGCTLIMASHKLVTFILDVYKKKENIWLWFQFQFWAYESQAKCVQMRI